MKFFLDIVFFFFFQAEDGIRDIGVTGVQTCALPILRYGISGPLHLFVLLRIGLLPATPGRSLVLTLLGGVPYFLLTAGALAFTSATHGSILNPGGTMVFAPLLAWLVLGDKPGAGVMVGVAILVLGLLMIGGEGLLEGAGGGRAWIGDLLLLWSGFDWALFGVLMRRWALSGLRTACVMGACSILWLPVHVAVFGLGGIGRKSTRLNSSHAHISYAVLCLKKNTDRDK